MVECALFIVFMSGLVLSAYGAGSVTFNATSTMDFYNQYYWNNPAAISYVSGSGPNVMIAADGFNSVPLPNDITMFTYYDTIYGRYDYSNPAKPFKIPASIGFSHASFATAKIVKGKWQNNFTNTPSVWTKLQPTGSNFYWPQDGIYVNGYYHQLVNQNYGNAEIYNLSRWLVIPNVLDNPQQWNFTAAVDTPINWQSFADDGKSDIVYLFGSNNKDRVLGAVSRCELGKGIFNNVQCWSNISGTPSWSSNCNTANLVPLYNVANWIVFDGGMERWNPFLNKWIRAVTINCDFRIYSADVPTGPWVLSQSFWKPSWFGFDTSIFCYQPNLHPTLSTSSNEMIASVCTWDFGNYYNGTGPIYHREYPSQAPYGDMWVYLPFAIKLTFNITGQSGSIPSFQPPSFSGCSSSTTSSPGAATSSSTSSKSSSTTSSASASTSSAASSASGKTSTTSTISSSTIQGPSSLPSPIPAESISTSSNPTSTATSLRVATYCLSMFVLVVLSL